jgi:hypothetical protein
VNRVGDPTSIKRLGGRTGYTCVSFSPSKIPYGGFSPVRLQTGIQLRPSPAGLYAVKAGTSESYGHFRGITVDPSCPAIQSRGPWLPCGLCCPAGSLLTMASSEPLPCSRSAYFLRLPAISTGSGSPLLSAPLSNRAISRTPADRSGASCCYFPDRTSLHQIRTGSASALSYPTSVLVGCVTRLTSSLSLRPDWLLARHRHGLLRSSFRSAGRPFRTSNITTRLQQITAAGLSPARDAALWAADGSTRIFTDWHQRSAWKSICRHRRDPGRRQSLRWRQMLFRSAFICANPCPVFSSSCLLCPYRRPEFQEVKGTVFEQSWLVNCVDFATLFFA